MQASMSFDSTTATTALGQTVVFALLVGYLFQKRSNLRVDRAALRIGVVKRVSKIVAMGASTFVIDLAMGVMAMIFNMQTLALGGGRPLPCGA